MAWPSLPVHDRGAAERKHASWRQIPHLKQPTKETTLNWRQIPHLPARSELAADTTVGGYISVPARIQISWDLVGQSVGPGLVDPIRPGCCRVL